MSLGWIALFFFVAAVVMALLKLDPYGFACVAAGGALCVVALALELRQRHSARLAVDRGEQRVFSEGGMFGARRSPQTHNRMT